MTGPRQIASTRGSARSQPAPTHEESERPRRREDEHAPANDEEFHLSRAAGDELKRLAAHPREEGERLREEVREGEKGAGLALFTASIALWVWLAAGLLMLIVFLVAYFVA